MNALRRIGFALFAPVLALVVALLISAVVMAVLGVNPLKAFEVMLNFGYTPSQQITQLVVVLNRAIPLFLSGLGVAFGWIGSAGVTHFLTSLLVGVRPIDPATFLGVALLLLAVSVLATIVTLERRHDR